MLLMVKCVFTENKMTKKLQYLKKFYLWFHKSCSWTGLPPLLKALFQPFETLLCDSPLVNSEHSICQILFRRAISQNINSTIFHKQLL